MNGATHTNNESESPNRLSQDEMQEKIKSIIDHQFDLEIYLKHREISAIKEEIGKAEDLLSDIRLAVRNDIAAASAPDTHHNTRRSALQTIVSNKSFPLPSISNSLGQDTNRHVRMNSRRSSNGTTKWLYGRRADGVYVSLACPRCHRDDFANQQGFLNHCRLAHGLEFGPYEEMIKQCGTPVDESEVPLDHPIRLRAITKPLSFNSVKKANIKRPTIKEYDEDVVLDSDDEDNALVLPNREVPLVDDAQLPDNETASTENTENNLDSTATEQQTNGPTAKPLDDKADDHGNGDKKDSIANSNRVESISVAVNQNAPEHGSRFYIKRRVIVGNVSKFIPIGSYLTFVLDKASSFAKLTVCKDKREGGLRQYTHKWMIYVTTPPGAEDIASFLSCVRYHLHPSYKPNDVIDITKPPFHLTRLGWGEFPIRVQLLFSDSRRNKVVDVFHQLRLDHTHSGQQTLGAERYIDLELDRNTEFVDPQAVKVQTQIPNAQNLPSGQVVQRRDPLDDLMREMIMSYPIISPLPSTQLMTYSCAPTTNMYFEYHEGRRKALEWHRARDFRLGVQQKAIEKDEAILRQAADALTTKKCVLWCRSNGFSPAKSEGASIGKPVANNMQEELALGYCKFCGTLRGLHVYDTHVTDDSCPHRPSTWSSRKRTGGVSSVTSILPLLQKLGSGWDEMQEQDDMDLDVDHPMSWNKNASNNNESDPRAIELVSNIKQIENEMNIDDGSVIKERGIDWIWQTIDQLRLPTVVANNIVEMRDGSITAKDERSSLIDAMDQRLTAGSILYEATKVFLKRIVTRGLDVYRNELSEDKTLAVTDKIEQSKRKLFVPHHIYQALQENEQFDFLTNKYLNLEDGTDMLDDG